jgi:hypothetical protein
MHLGVTRYRHLSMLGTLDVDVWLDAVWAGIRNGDRNWANQR